MPNRAEVIRKIREIPAVSSVGDRGDDIKVLGYADAETEAIAVHVASVLPEGYEITKEFSDAVLLVEGGDSSVDQ